MRLLGILWSILLHHQYAHDEAVDHIRKRSLEVAPTTLAIFSPDRELWPTTVIVEINLDNIKVNQIAKYVGQKSFNSKLICPNTVTDVHATSIAQDGPIRWSLMLFVAIIKSCN